MMILYKIVMTRPQTIYM